jgi:hypothetical protein
MMGAFELAYHPETPYRVVINEAIELAKAYGATDGFKYVNGVLDRLALKLREGPSSIPPQTAPVSTPATNCGSSVPWPFPPGTASVPTPAPSGNREPHGARHPQPRSIRNRGTSDRDSQTASSSFTHYWTLDTCKLNADGQGFPLEHTADNAFLEADVKAGDRIYVVTNPQGSLHLIGRLVVGSIVSFEEAKRLLGDGVWDARDHVLARPGSGTPKRFDRIVPTEIVRSLHFFRADGIRGLVLSPDGKVDRQTLRHVSRLTADSAKLLENLLG